MKKIVVSAIAAIMVTVGTYLIAFALSASQPTAFAFAVLSVFAFATAVVAAFSVAFAGTAFAAFAFAIAVVATFAFATTATTDAATAFAAFAFATAVGAFVVFAIGVAEQEGIKYRWAYAVYALEAGTIVGAFLVNSAGWCIAIALSGVVALLVLWRLAPKPIATLDVPSASTVPERNGA